MSILLIHADEFDATDKSNEQSIVNNDDTGSIEEVVSNSETVQVKSISVGTEDNTTEYSLDENEVKNIVNIHLTTLGSCQFSSRGILIH